MDFKKTNAPVTTVTRDVNSMLKNDMNVYELVNVLGKRANQISIELKNELEKKLQEFASYTDNLEEVFENREQIEISRYYEKLPKPTLIATQEYTDGKLYIRDTASNAKLKK
ncbi:MAG: DNA-directed RNA polymerase subunit omega [Paludibacteraceae bacterium]|nr:DNA-directed RNA polymerase subunit omega [Paludibacteraceae bacterium]MBP5136706.1 DNA-directed RNA polymerase subunit omega [Paludibacteraceae bacterium]MBP5742873.1 DNA-directed RNA polymerase subunit omega [Paludibacteraceae bacterium]